MKRHALFGKKNYFWVKKSYYKFDYIGIALQKYR